MSGADGDLVEFRQVQPPSDRKFGLTIGTVLVAIGGARSLWLAPSAFALILLGSGALLVLLAVVAPRSLGAANRLWMRLGAVMAAIVNPLVLLVMFAAIFVPVGSLTRLFGRDILGRKPKPEGESYWADCVSEAVTRQRLEDQF